MKKLALPIMRFASGVIASTAGVSVSTHWQAWVLIALVAVAGAGK